MKYRSEIDGLRAVAVLPVILFHAGFSTFSGGFVGVDIFFVISGYLITAILITDLNSGRFSILHFYERRARRILPALFFAMLCTLPFAWFWMNPVQLKDFAQSLVAVTTFTSNILFWRETGYFNAASELKPLLHTWSLAVEEQFYIFFPVLLLVLWRFSSRIVLYIIVALSVTSLFLSHWGSIAAPSATFYLIPTRAWELGAGSICAFLLKNRQPYKNNALSGLGLILILGSIFLYDSNTPFPSLWALVPVGGTALIILFAQSTTLTANLLSIRPIVFIGLISFSAYLWHQPLFAFAHMQSLSAPPTSTMYLLIALSFGLAVFSWRYIEQPFRGRENSFRITRRQVFGLSISAMALFSAIGLAGHLTGGAPFRQTPSGVAWQDLDLDRRLALNPGLGLQCIEGNSFQNVVTNPNCRTGDTPRVLLWGDSYAMHLAGALQASDLSEKHAFIQLALSQCSPILNRGINGSIVTAQECIDFNDQVAAYLKESDNIKFVIMSSPYGCFERATFDRAGQRRDTIDEDYCYTQMVETAEMIVSLGKVPVFVTPPPANGTDIGQCLGSALARHLPLSVCNYSNSAMSLERIQTYDIMDQLKDHYTVIDLRDTLCFSGVCTTEAEGVFLYRDAGHLSVEGSSLIGREMDPFRSLIAH